MESGAAGLDVPRSSLSDLVTSMAPRLPEPESVCLLYALLHRSALFLDYCLVRSDPELLLLPLLRALHDGCARRPAPTGGLSVFDHGETYMLLVVLLSLSSDAGWAAAIHRVDLAVRRGGRIEEIWVV